MKIKLPLSIVKHIDHSALVNGQAFDANTAIHTPLGKYTCVHYGIMIPNLPAPFNFLNMIVVAGQPLVKIFRNSHLIKTSDLDTANLLIGTAATQPNLFSGYSIQHECLLATNGQYLKFGNDLVIEANYPDIKATRQGHTFNYELALKATDKIAHFVKLAGSMYEHWSLLCEYQGYLELDGQKTQVQGLCTFEYARGVNINIPIRFFTYQILNINNHTQVLFVDTHGPMGLVLQSRVYVRSVDHHGGIYERGLKSVVHEYQPEPVTTPNGIKMRLPRVFEWQVNDDQGNPLISIYGKANGDFKYGMAGGYAGSYQYEGQFKGQHIQGRGYIEYIDPISN